MVYMNESAAARKLDICARTLKSIAARGEIGYRLIGKRRRYTQADLDEYSEGRRICPINSRLESIGSINEKEQPTGNDVGTNRERESGVDAPNVHLLAQQIFKQHK